MSDEKQPDGEATLRVLAMPSDVNINGDIFGGWVLSQMDIASGIVAAQRAKGRVTTVAVDAMQFIRPVQVGDVLCVWAWISERRIEELREQFGDQIHINYQFINVFGDAPGKFASQWADRGDRAGLRKKTGGKVRTRSGGYY